MKAIMVRFVSAAGLAALLAGCTTPYGDPDYTGNGALIGGASGAAIGALADRCAPGAGALIGGAAGLIAGGLIGHNMDRHREIMESAPPPPVYVPAPASPPTVADIEAMSRAGLSDDVIIGQIRNSHAVYHLDTNTLIGLHDSGVSQNVIAYMISTGNTVVAEAPPASPPPQVTVVAPGPGYVWVGGDWVWSGETWVWLGGRWVLPPYPHAIWVRPHWVHGYYGWHRVPGCWR
jgi:Glycine zipper